MQVYPNPNNGNFMVKFNLRDKGEVKLTISDASGKLIENTVLKNLQAGENTYSKRIKNLINGGIYYITIETTYEKATQKIIVEP
ncbi:MAG: T9SS type A sorting domain-containing protein [Bacteroidetes bacterium]|nr:T9SS type A sorting domain-containing protein [Bacteroidota bacterium]